MATTAKENAKNPSARSDLETRGSATDIDIRDIEHFLYHEARCLDDHERWEEWVGLFTDDGHYWIPYTREQDDAIDMPSIVYEDKVLLAIRIGRLKHPHAWGQQPSTRASRLVGNVMIDGVDAKTGDLIVRSTVHMLEFRADRYLQYGGHCTYRLARNGDGFLIRSKRVDLISADGIYEDIIQVLP